MCLNVAVFCLTVVCSWLWCVCQECWWEAETRLFHWNTILVPLLLQHMALSLSSKTGFITQTQTVIVNIRTTKITVRNFSTEHTREKKWCNDYDGELHCVSKNPSHFVIKCNYNVPAPISKIWQVKRRNS